MEWLVGTCYMYMKGEREEEVFAFRSSLFRFSVFAYADLIRVPSGAGPGKEGKGGGK